MEQILLSKSVRFFPKWDRLSVSPLIGIIQFTRYVFQINPNASNWIELGSNIGESSTIFLSFPELKKLSCIDHDRSDIEILEKKFDYMIKSGRCSIHHTPSHKFAEKISDNSIDVVYIDASHEYNDVKKDIEIYWNKIKSGGFLTGHDYHHSPDVWPGVKRAVDEFMEKSAINDIILFPDTSWLIRKP